jgi:hypothetical protein
MDPEGVLSFSDRYLRLTSVGMVFRKPGHEAITRFDPNPELRAVLFPASELRRLEGTSVAASQAGNLRDFTISIRNQIGSIRSAAQSRGIETRGSGKPPVRPEDFRIRHLIRAILVRLWWRLSRRI